MAPLLRRDGIQRRNFFLTAFAGALFSWQRGKFSDRISFIAAARETMAISIRLCSKT
jgi:hypothetical protein